ncbi:MAG: molybdate ABC transporter substrate-binding protein [Sphingomonadales bacterium]|nr:molybdate ABC transporter substrate-binding protein [Sphingomonadales bacterium]
MKRFFSIIGSALLLALGHAPAAHAQDVPNIAAAADLRLALTGVADAFRKDTGLEVKLTFGSSGTFFQQISQGAPFQLLFSADEQYVLDLAKARKALGTGKLYAIGRLALVAPKGSPLALDGNLNGLRDALAKGQVTRFAIANPDHAPYGARAREALQHAGLWAPLQGKLVLGENVAQALQFATAGGAQGGVVSLALVLDPAFATRADYMLIPANWHQPIRQRMALLTGAGTTARRFYAYMQTPPARRILVRYGFTLPGDR